MSRIRLYIDEDSQDSGLISALRSAGVDVLTSADAEMNGRSDQEQLGFATDQGRVIYTRNARDFRVLSRRLIEAGQPHAGIVYWPAHFSIGEQRRRLIALWETRASEELIGIEEFLSNWASDA